MSGNTVENWINEENEIEMEQMHVPMWNSLIDALPLDEIAGGRHLDYGCNRGGFLRLLHDRAPLEKGLGIDISEGAVQAAIQNKGTRPLNYIAGSTPSVLEEVFDTATSYEVLYLIKNIKDHFQEMAERIVTGGSYFVCTGCHTDMPLWQSWYESLSKSSNLPVCNHSPEDIVRAANGAGFNVAVRSLNNTRFIDYSIDGAYPKVQDCIDYFTKYSLVFKCSR